MTPFKHILVPTDFSPTAGRAVAMAIELATGSGAALTLLHVVEVPVYPYEGVFAAPVDLLTPARDAAEHALARELAKVRVKMPSATSTLSLGHAADEIVAAVREAGADLVVIGTHGRRGVLHFLLGSVAEKVVRTSPVPVLTVRGEE